MDHWLVDYAGALLLFTAYMQRRSVKQQKYANNLLALKSLERKWIRILFLTR